MATAQWTKLATGRAAPWQCTRTLILSEHCLFHPPCASQKREDMHMEAYQAYYRDPDEDAYRAGVNYLADKLSGREAAAIKIQVVGC